VVHESGVPLLDVSLVNIKQGAEKREKLNISENKQ
jgi:hypothetical protein